MPFKFFLLILIVLPLQNTWSQNTSVPRQWGLYAGYGTQQTKPFHSLDYDYEHLFIIGEWTLKRYSHKKIRVHINAESGYFLAQHQLINKWFTTTEDFKNFPADFQQKMTQKKSIHQIVFHLAGEVSFVISPRTHLFGYVAIGPMWASKQTERLAKGLAFSDNVGIGIKTKLSNTTWISSRVVLRHESNANLKFPNSGHNTIGFSLGVLFNVAD